jgi:hypothetical protein
MAGFQTEDERDKAYLLHFASPFQAQAADFQVTLEDSGKDPQLQKGPVRLRGHANL